MKKIVSNKIDSLQILRAYAALLVAMCHIWNDGWLPGILVDFGGFGVDLFFVLSGFIMCLTVNLNTGSNLGNAKLFLKKRFTRIFPIYLICAIPLILFVSKVEGIKSVYYYIGNILLLPSFTNDPNYALALPPGWTLAYEMFFYYIFAFFLLLSIKKEKIILSIFILLTGLVLFIQLAGLQGPQLRWVNFNYIIGDPLLCNFALGIISYFIYIKFKDKVSLHINSSIMLLLLFSLIGIILMYFKFPRFICSGIPAFFIITTFLFTNNESLNNNFVKKTIFIGDASYSIYLTHFYFAFFKPKILILAQTYISNESIARNIVGITLLTGAVVAGCLFYILVEKPIINIFSKKGKS